MNAFTPPKDESRFSGPGHYRIEFEGKVGVARSGRFGNMRVLQSGAKDGRAVTVLGGRVGDQAELAGILNTLYELHLPLLSVRRLDDRPSASENQG